jgi:hypothetical protein
MLQQSRQCSIEEDIGTQINRIETDPHKYKKLIFLQKCKSSTGGGKMLYKAQARYAR